MKRLSYLFFTIAYVITLVGCSKVVNQSNSEVGGVGNASNAGSDLMPAETAKAYRERLQSFLDGKTRIILPYEILTKDEIDYDGEFYFSLKDLDKDGIDELLLIFSEDGHDFAANVFTPDMTGDYSEILINYYDEENNKCYYNTNTTLSTITIYELQSGKMNVIETYETDTLDEFETFVYYCTNANGEKKEITEAEYKSIESKIPMSDAFEKYELTEEKISEVLK